MLNWGMEEKERLQQKMKCHVQLYMRYEFVDVGLTKISIIVTICRRWQWNVGEDGRLGHRGPDFL